MLFRQHLIHVLGVMKGNMFPSAERNCGLSWMARNGLHMIEPSKDPLRQLMSKVSIRSSPNDMPLRK
ncbi:hypothetical protein L195_g008679 [Trifolium pratense]|uniref:Uncharacterized protein n=1 Tax=Trifolium pratense TaxID=57577 RepID=A0A2K3P9U2_TRIPR|nr:hypothetical protein L195_g008679 [Trifolium pratense]